MASTTARLMMPSVPEALFLRGIEETVRANAAWVPPHGRREPLHPPFLIGVGENLGCVPRLAMSSSVCVASRSLLQGGGLSLIDLAVIDLDRAAPKAQALIKLAQTMRVG